MKLILIAFGFVAAIAGHSQLQPGSPWPMYRHDAQHTNRSDRAILNPTMSYVNLEVPGQVLALDSDGTIYIGWGNRFAALRSDGKIKWSIEHSQYYLAGPAISADGHIYVGGDNGDLLALRRDGSVDWTFHTNGPIYGTPAIGYDGTIYIGSGDQNMYAVSPQGVEKWRLALRGEIKTSCAVAADGTIFVCDGTGTVSAINSDGDLKWQYEIPAIDIGSPVVREDGVVVVHSKQTMSDSNAFAFFPNGTIAWTYYIKSGQLDLATGNSNTTYAVSYDSTRFLVALDHNGNLIWKAGASYTPAIAKDGALYAGNQVLAPDGSIKWYAPAGTYALSADGCLVGNGIIYRRAGHVVWSTPSALGYTMDIDISPGGIVYCTATYPYRLLSFDLDGNVRRTLPLTYQATYVEVADEDTILTSTIDRTQVDAFDMRGNKKWTLTSGSSIQRLGTRADGTVIMWDGKSIFVYDRRGQLRRTLPGGLATVGPILAWDGTIYETQSGRRVLQYDPITGKIIWTYNIDSNRLDLGVRLLESDNEGSLYIGLIDNSTIRLNPDRTEAWRKLIPQTLKFEFDSSGHILATNGSLVSLYDSEANLIWSYKLPYTTKYPATFGRGGDVYVSTYPSQNDPSYFTMLDSAGNVRYQFRDWNTNQKVSFDEFGRMIYFDNNSTFQCVEKDGSIRYAAVTPGNGLWRSPKSYGNRAFASVRGTLSAVEFWTRRAAGQVARTDLSALPQTEVADLRLKFSNPVYPELDWSIPIAPEGSFASDLPVGEFDLLLKTTNWLRSTIHDLDSRAGDLTDLSYALINGDANEDNRVDLKDISAIFVSFEGEGADLNRDGATDLLDLQIAFRNFGTIGDN